MAKTFQNMAAQGDFLIRRIDNLPSDAQPLPVESGPIVVAHSETGHDHVMEREHVTAYTPPEGEDLFRMFITVDAPTEIVHKRSFDTHEALLVTPGVYEIRRQREYIPEGFRLAQD